MELPPAVVARARALAAGAGGPLSQALAALETQTRQLQAATDAARAAASAATHQAEALEAERRGAEEAARAAAAEASRHTAEETERTLAEVSSLLAELRAAASVERAETARTVLAAQAKEARARAEASRLQHARGSHPPDAGGLAVGRRVYHLGLGRDVEVLALEGDEALVAAGSLKVRVAKDALSSAREGKPAPRLGASARRSAAEARAQQVAPAPLEAGVPRVDVRGLRAEDALREVETFLDRAFRDGEPTVLVVHGHGTGALRQALRSALAASPYVQSLAPGESHQGGDGVTRITLRDA
jgi:DNA mismatch repair protein MutS2